MNGFVSTKIYRDLQPDPAEILRYEGMPKTSAPDPLMEECLSELGEIRGRLCWRQFPIRRTEDGRTDLGFCRTASKNLAANLKNCSSLVLFAGTLGIEIDRLLAKYGRLSPAKQLWFQAIGAAGVEAMCDAFCEDVRALAGSAEAPVRQVRLLPMLNSAGDWALTAARSLDRGTGRTAAGTSLRWTASIIM